jgi:DNA-binding IclR family transcriptional regulator
VGYCCLRPASPQEGIRVSVDDNGGVSSVQRALRVLEVVAASNDGVQAKAVARRLGYNLSSTYRLLNTLVQEGYLVHLGELHGFGLGYKIPPLYQLLRERLSVEPRIADVVDRVHAMTGAAAYYSIYRGLEPVVAYVAESPDAPAIHTLDVGTAGAAHATAFGKVMLAALPVGDVLSYCETNGLTRYTERTIDTVDDLMPQLELIRSTGVAVEIEEVAPGIACMAGAVTDADGRLRATVAISTSLKHFHHKHPQLENAIRQATRRCSALLS